MPRMHAPATIARTLTLVAATAAVVLPALAAHAQDAVQWRVEDGGNGHWYLLTTGEDKPSWQEASNAAVEMGGHLVTITSQGENDWVVNALGASDEHIGAFQDISADDYSEPGGGWRWVTGEPWSYQNWSGSGPDNKNLEEPSEELAHFCCSGRWNDIYPTKRNAAIEWSADCNGDGIVDYGQILDGTFADEDGNGVPDPCDPVQWRVEDGGNGHWYRGILDSSGPEGITWDEAREIAIGGGGDLASLETQSELEWVYETIGSDPSLWWANAGENDGPYLGGFQDELDPDYSEPDGGWRWLSGTPITVGSWGEGAPNDAGGQDFLHFWDPRGSISMTFDDVSNLDSGGARSLIIEWSADCNGDGIVDYGQIRDGSLGDVNQNGVPDSCEVIHVPDDVATIQGAIDVALPGSTVRIAAGTYLLDSTIDLLGKSLTIQGEMDADGTPLTVLDGQNVHRVLACTSGETASCVIERLVVAHGSTASGFGGGLLVDAASPTIRDCVFRDNSAGYGGAIACDNGAAPHVSNCRILQNDAKDGGGIYLEDGSTIHLASSIVGDNLATEQGGGIHVAYQSDAEVRDCRIEANQTIGTQGRDGGGIYCVDSTLLVSETDFVENTCATSSGGAAMFVAHSTVDLDRCLFDGNSGPAGGAIYASDGSVIDGRSVQFISNTANSGGAIFSVRDATVHLSGGVFEGNVCPPYPQGNAWEHFASGGSRSIDDFLFFEDQNLWLNPGGILVSNSTFCGVGLQGNDGGGNIVEPTCDLGDCDGDGVPDFIEVLQGASDCDGNGIPDECDLTETLAASEPRTPESVVDFVEFDASGMADARETVTVELSARGDLATTNEFMFVYLDDVNLGLAFVVDGAACDIVSTTIEIPSAEWNAAGLDGTRLVRISGNAIDPTACPDPFTAIDVTVPVAFEDCNANGLWDACEVADGSVLDSDADGVIDDCDGCPDDPNKTEPGVCGCGTPESGDTDADGILDCVDPCPTWPYDCSEDGQTLFVAAGQPVQLAVDQVPAGGIVELGAGTHVGSGDRVVTFAGKPITLRGAAGGDPAIIDGEFTRRGLYCSDIAASGSVVENLEIRHGDLGFAGGGAYLRTVDFTFRNCRFVGNRATGSAGEGDGGGLYALEGTITLEGCDFEDNDALRSGGGVRIDHGSILATNCDFDLNHAAERGGGLDMAHSSGDFLSCAFSSNQSISISATAGGGGGMSLVESVASMTDCSFDSNQSGCEGGGINVYRGTATIDSSSFTRNIATTAGGGVSIYESTDSVVTDCLLEENSANGVDDQYGMGGGIYGNQSDSISLVSCIIRANVGGGIRTWKSTVFALLDTVVCGNDTIPIGGVGEFTDLGGNCISEICDSDEDGVLDCDDACPGEDDLLDTDKDGTPDCLDPCPTWPYDCSEDGQTIFVAIGQPIRQAIEIAPSGGTVDLAAGTFTPSGSIDPGGKAVTIQGAVDEFGLLLTTIDVGGTGSVMVFQSGEGPETVIRDLVLTGGSAVYGGGIEFANASSPTILGCLVTGNTASEYGGGINCYLGCNPSIQACTISGNAATLAGGGVSIDASAPTILDCIIEGNAAPAGAGIYFYESADAGLGDSTVCGNDADQTAGDYTDLQGNCIVDDCGDDLDENGIPDACDPDCNGDGIPDSVETDCDENGIPDECEILDGSTDDCNENGVPDSCDIEGGFDEDENGNGVPDDCDVASGDLNLDGCIDAGDLGLLVALWGITDPPVGDLDGDGVIGAADLGQLLGAWRPCDP